MKQLAVMEKNAEGKLAITRVNCILGSNFRVKSSRQQEELDKMHHAAHENCFIANSVKTEITVEPQ